MNPYDRPVEEASERIDSPAPYRSARSLASLLRSDPLTRAPRLRFSALFTSRKVRDSLRYIPYAQ